jgi:hypothetical protein
MLMQTRSLIGLLVVSTVVVGPPAASAQDAARTDGWVVLALDDYRALRARASRRSRTRCRRQWMRR